MQSRSTPNILLALTGLVGLVTSAALAVRPAAAQAPPASSRATC